MSVFAFPEMNHRSDDIESPAAGTNQWLLQHPAYVSWTACQRGLCWIKGKPGSGKSTLLWYALEKVGKASGFQDGDLVLSFFFHGRGSELQKTPLGLFRSLLYQMLGQTSNVQPCLVADLNKWRDAVKTAGQEYKWRMPELRRLLRSVFSNLLENRSVWLLVDALDECGETNAADVFEDFKSLIQMPSPTDHQLRICFTCRHYPLLGEGSTSEICMEDENQGDVRTYVQGRLSPFPDLVASLIPTLIISRADGVFMWVRLVVDRVLALERRRKGLKEIEDEIYAVALGLYELYDELVKTMDDKRNSLKILQWICFAERPLTLDELRWAMIIDPAGPQRSMKEYEGMKEYIGDSARMGGRVRALSCGLAETVPSFPTPVVQFIHQSVQDFFLEKGLKCIHDNLSVTDTNCSKFGSTGTAFELISRACTQFLNFLRNHFVSREDLVIGRAHYKLSRTCIRYLSMKEIAESTTSSSKELQSAFPFLEYAVSWWVTHTQQSETKGVPQDDLLSYFSWPSEALVKVWIQIYHTLGRLRFNQPESGSSLLHIISVHQFMGPLRKILAMTKQIGAKLDAKSHHGRTPLSHAARYGSEAVVKLLVEQDDVDTDSKDTDGRTPLSYAAEEGSDVVVKLLVERDDVDADSKDTDGRTPLSYAAQWGRAAIVQLLLQQDGININPKDINGRSPLWWAVNNNKTATAELLRKSGAIETGDPH